MKRTRKNTKKLMILSVAVLAVATSIIIPMKTCGGNKVIPDETFIPNIELQTSQAQVETSEPEITYTEMTMFTTCKVHLREEMSTSSTSLGIVPASELVTAQVTEEEWYLVSYGDKQGYIYADYLHIYDPELHLDLGIDYVHQDLVREMIEVFNLDVDEYFFYGMMYTENRFQNEPESVAGAQGMLQIMPSTWSFLYEKFQKEYPEYTNRLIDDPTDRTSNIILGMYCIYYTQQSYGFDSVADNAHAILTAYNRGLSGAKEYYKNHGTYETSYSQEILRAAEYIREHKSWKEGL